MTTTKTVWIAAMVLACAGCGASGAASGSGPEEATASEPVAAQQPPRPDEFVGDPANCTQAWYEKVEATLHVLDDDGHGPDITAGADRRDRAALRAGQ